MIEERKQQEAAHSTKLLITQPDWRETEHSTKWRRRLITEPDWILSGQAHDAETEKKLLEEKWLVILLVDTEWQATSQTFKLTLWSMSPKGLMIAKKIIKENSWNMMIQAET